MSLLILKNRLSDRLLGGAAHPACCDDRGVCMKGALGALHAWRRLRFRYRHRLRYNVASTGQQLDALGGSHPVTEGDLL